MNRPARQRRGDGGGERGQGLALAGLHLGKFAVQHRPCALQLNRVMAQSELPPGRFANQREAAGDQIGPKSVAQQRAAQLSRGAGKLVVAQIGNSGAHSSTSFTRDASFPA